LQLRPVGGPGALTAIDVLLDHHGAQRLGLAAARLALGGNGVALGVAVPLGLLLRADPDVDDGAALRGFSRTQGRLGYFTTRPGMTLGATQRPRRARLETLPIVQAGSIVT
jgi:hypothetical protein